jgi:hypothetical protein
LYDHIVRVLARRAVAVVDVKINDNLKKSNAVEPTDAGQEVCVD